MDLIELLNTDEAIVSVLKINGRVSIGLKTEYELEYKWISKELYELLVKELSEQKGGYQNVRPNNFVKEKQKCINPDCIGSQTLKSKVEKYRGTCDQCVSSYKAGLYPGGFPPHSRYEGEGSVEK